MTEGRVTVRLDRHNSGDVDIQLDQPGNINRLLIGCRPDAALQTITALFSLCRTAQAHAAVTALEQAAGIRVSGPTAAARQALTDMETLREHVLRIAIDWARLVGETPQLAGFRCVMTLETGLAECLSEEGRLFSIGGVAAPAGAETLAIVEKAEQMLEGLIFNEPLVTWRRRCGWSEILDWAQSADTAAARLLNRVVEADWREAGHAQLVALRDPSVLDIDAWLRRDPDMPTTLPGRRTMDTPETTVFSRQADDPMLAGLAGNGLGCRLVARLLELARLPARIRWLIGGASHEPRRFGASRPGIGVAAVEAARGLLIHAVELDSNRIRACRIIPPTLWNFDTNGIARRCLSRIVGSERERLEQAHLLVSAIDPCVAHEVRFH